MKFQIGEELSLENEKKAKIKDFLGEGGQGEVYLADVEGELLALKWYKEKPSNDFVANLKSNIEKGAPSKEFLFPTMLTKAIDGSVGYIMGLRPKNYKSFVGLLNGKERFNNYVSMLNWCINLSKAFKMLHQYGFSYQDLNDGSFFFDPETGDALICDNDNVTATGENLGILGKMKYMAPEVLLEKNIPDVHSDRFSLAIILFMCLNLGHPFEGAKIAEYSFMDEVAEREVYGSKAIYIFNKNDTSNRPVRGYHKMPLKKYPLLPDYIKDAFHKTFVEGLIDRENSRTTELEWVKLFMKYRDSLIACDKCGFQYDYSLGLCPSCKATVAERATLKIGNNAIKLEVGKKIYEPHIDKYSPNYDNVVGEVIANKNNPKLWGIRNLTSRDFEIIDKLGNRKIIVSGGVIPIIKELQIEFNTNIKGEIL